ncbi:MAG: 50S ribosomal protein L9 [Planctomycetota bacterium]
MAKSQRTNKILLMVDVPSLGKVGEVVEVAPGYARNYLLPRQKGAIPSEENLRLVQARRGQIEAERLAKEDAQRELAERIPETNVTLEMKVSPDGTLYGSVTPQMISKAMQDIGLPVTPQAVRLKNPIKEIGQFDVPIHVYEDVVANARIWVVSAPD